MKKSFLQTMKVTAVSVVSLLAVSCGITRSIDRAAEKSIKQALENRADKTTLERLLSHQVDTVVANRVARDMDIHAALLFYCAPKISNKIASYKAQDGKELIRQEKDYFVVWQVDEKKPDTLQNIISAIDPQTKMQVCVTYNKDTRDLVLHLGGTDFSNIKDMAQAGTAAFGGLSPRAATGVQYADSVAIRMKKLYPDVLPAAVHASIIAHSQGGTSVPGMSIGLVRNGFTINKTLILDPFGAKEVYSRIETLLQLPEGTMQKNVATEKPAKPGLLSKFRHATEAVGNLEVGRAQGHLGKNFIDAYSLSRAGKKPATPVNGE